MWTKRYTHVLLIRVTVSNWVFDIFVTIYCKIKNIKDCSHTTPYGYRPIEKSPDSFPGYSGPNCMFLRYTMHDWPTNKKITTNTVEIVYLDKPVLMNIKLKTSAKLILGTIFYRLLRRPFNDCSDIWPIFY